MKHSIVLVPFPFDDFKASKVRPAICLTPPVGKYGHIIIAFITSRVDVADESSDIILSERVAGFDQTGLKMESAIRLHRMVTLPSSLIKRKLGELPASFHSEIDNRLRQLFQL